jgi:hypothetical protein
MWQQILKKIRKSGRFKKQNQQGPKTKSINVAALRKQNQKILNKMKKNKFCWSTLHGFYVISKHGLKNEISKEKKKRWLIFLLKKSSLDCHRNNLLHYPMSNNTYATLKTKPKNAKIKIFFFKQKLFARLLVMHQEKCCQ